MREGWCAVLVDESRLFCGMPVIGAVFSDNQPGLRWGRGQGIRATSKAAKLEMGNQRQPVPGHVRQCFAVKKGG